ncbi:MAG: hypothetical protein ACR2QG_08845 [Gammaproteobacteria bacterium]
MTHWAQIDTTLVPASDTELTLFRWNDDFAIRIAGEQGDLMNSRMHHSEDVLAELGCSRLAAVDQARVLIGGLGMGFTLAAALKILGQSAEVVVAELVPAVVEWNRGPLGQCAGRPVEDERTKVHVGDVTELLKQKATSFDAILLDVDNGPEPMTHADNVWLYSMRGLQRIYERLRPEGIVAVWSAKADPSFTHRLQKIGFDVDVRTVRARPGKGPRHKIFVARKLA